jgi:hypothetical protein
VQNAIGTDHGIFESLRKFYERPPDLRNGAKGVGVRRSASQNQHQQKPDPEQQKSLKPRRAAINRKCSEWKRDGISNGQSGVFGHGGIVGGRVKIKACFPKNFPPPPPRPGNVPALGASIEGLKPWNETRDTLTCDGVSRASPLSAQSPRQSWLLRSHVRRWRWRIAARPIASRRCCVLP